MPRLPFRRWPDDAGDDLSPMQTRLMYADGYAGVESNPEKIRRARNEFDEHITNQGDWSYAKAEDAAYANSFVGSGSGKLSLLSQYVEQFYPDCYPGASQVTGDCVAHSQKNADLASFIAEVVAGEVDPVSGLTEGAPEVSLQGIKSGVLSTIWPWWWRGYNSAGWQCYLAAKVSTQHGCMLCQDHRTDLDLTHYNGKLAARYGRKSPPEEFDELGRQHLVRTATRAEGMEQCRDLLKNGFAITSCGSESFSGMRDENGVSKRTRTGWSHAMAILGFDDRPEIRRKYGDPLACFQNSWGVWNSGPRKVYGANVEIPPGAFWAKWSDVKNRTMIAMSSVAGWPQRDLPDILEGW